MPDDHAAAAAEPASLTWKALVGAAMSESASVRGNWHEVSAHRGAGTLLTPGNAQRLTERLTQMRGAAMKVGQPMSKDGHGVLPLQRKFVGTFMLCVRLGARLDLNAIFGEELDEAAEASGRHVEPC